MRKLYAFGLIALACIFMAQAFAEEFTMSTYYPAPFGVYNNMRVMNSLSVGTTNPTELLEVVGGTAASGSGRGISLQAESGEQFGNSDGGDIILTPGSGYGTGADGSVGIGTVSPGSYGSAPTQTQLDVNGYAAANDVWLKDANGGAGEWASEMLGDVIWFNGLGLVLQDGTTIQANCQTEPLCRGYASAKIENKKLYTRAQFASPCCGGLFDSGWVEGTSATVSNSRGSATATVQGSGGVKLNYTGIYYCFALPNSCSASTFWGE